VDLAALPVGRCEDGSLWRLRLVSTHVLIAGATGSGKGSVIWSMVRALLPAIASGWVQVWALDPKRMELSFGRTRTFTRSTEFPFVVVLVDELAPSLRVPGREPASCGGSGI
jgi:DNA segregation ATPase FtsK/SpoIIIE-like protein